MNTVFNLDRVKGTGRKGRSCEEDIQAYVKTAVKAFETGTVSSAAAGNGVANGAGLGLLPWPKVDFSKFGEVEEVELSRINKISGANLHRNMGNDSTCYSLRSHRYHRFRSIP